ncbi:hypothetical protein ACHAXN_002146, partial [Cyclotella atomus]
MEEVNKVPQLQGETSESSWSAVGFGNIWRFPSLVYEYGGGAFFIPYAIAFFLIGIPLMVLEILLGHNNFWNQEQVTGSEAKAYFYNKIIGMSTLGDDLRPTHLVGKNVGHSFLTWAVIYFCVAFSVRVTGRITYVTMGLPGILLFIFLGRALSLPGSQDGVDEYIHDSNWEVLTERPEVWSKAVSQIFFSLSVTFGIMTAYGIAISNCLFSFSFVAGFAVFATLGHLALIEGLDSIKSLEYSSFGLVFGSWPVTLGTLPGGEHWIRLLFVMLFLLGIDSAFFFLEGFLTVLADTKAFSNVDRKITSFVLTTVAFLLSLMYATDAGLIFLDTIDYYINFVMLLVGGFECFSAAYFGSVILACCLWFGLSNADDALWAGFIGLVGFYVLAMTVVAFLMYQRMNKQPGRWTWGSIIYELLFRNIVDLKSDLSAVVGYLPFAWTLLIKYFIPPVILILFGLACDAKNADGTKVFGHYKCYVFSPYQILGILCL